MPMADFLRRMLIRLLPVAVLLASSGCALLQPEAPPPEPVPKQAPPPPPEPQPQAELPPVTKPAASARAVLDPQPVSARVAVVLTSSLPAYARVAEELTPWLRDYRSYDLDDRSRSPRQVFNAIADYQARMVVAIGLGAARTASTFATVPVVYSQVFNVSEYRLASETTRGVAMLPPMTAHVDAWRSMDPGIRDIGTIVGEGHEQLIAEAERAMSERGIRLHYAVANSDREALYHFKRLIRELDGYMLFPDNRILSRDVFTEIMTDAARHHVQVAVFNESLLKHGATFSASAVESDIAEKITITLNEIAKGNIDDVAAITPLSKVRIRTNPAMVRTFGLDVSGIDIVDSIAEAQR